jgi:hypothetical protein
MGSAGLLTLHSYKKKKYYALYKNVLAAVERDCFIFQTLNFYINEYE